MKNLIASITLTLFAFFAAGCAQNVSPNTYSAAEVGSTSKVTSGVVISKRLVNLNTSSNVGGVAGTIAGAGAGSAIGGSAASNIVGAVGGAVIGGLLGSTIDKSINTQQGYEYIVKLKTGKTISVVQNLEMQFEVHQHVFVVDGPRAHLIADTTV
ncbi:MAG TPA: hypothetical protein VJL60_00830 [Gammaproteobacteria bacterium]|nr:hypothetical protein [Gammaproteobacteria bacterium]